MKTNRGKFGADFHEETGYYFRPWMWGGVAVALIAAMSVGVWYFGVASSGVHGAGEQRKQVNSAVNRTQWYTHFFDLKTAYESQVEAVKLARQQLAAFNHDNPPGTPDPIGQVGTTRAQDETNVTGAAQQCVTTATAYNNDSLKTLVGARFKAAGLPDSLDPQNCEH